MKRAWLIRCVCLLMLWLGLVLSPRHISSLHAEDHFLTIGGGYSPTGNQVSLEKNVFFFRHLLAQLYGESVAHQVLFADGDDPGRDLQYFDPATPIPRANELLAKIHRQTKHLPYAYRTHQVENLFGPSSRNALQNWFEKVGAGLTAEDRLLIYATAHGGKGGKGDERTNTRLYLWNRQSISMREFTAMLDQIDPAVPVTLVMVQCYSGGFADSIFDEGKRESGWTDHQRCGFFATVHNRGAAGCTPDIREEDYHEYSTYFLAALLGETRTGSPVDRPDFDQDGEVSFAEAHAYALLTSTTIDISIRTSDVFLREFSKSEGTSDQPLLNRHSPVSQLLATASPARQAVIEGLSEQLGLAAADRAAETESLAKQLMEQKKDLQRQRGREERRHRQFAERLKRSVLQRWPELTNSWNPRVGEILRDESAALVDLIESHSAYAAFQSAEEKKAQLTEQIGDLDRRWVKCQRLIRELKTVALAANLPQVAEAATVERYQQLLAAEQQTLGLHARPAPRVSASR